MHAQHRAGGAGPGHHPAGCSLSMHAQCSVFSDIASRFGVLVGSGEGGISLSEGKQLFDQIPVDIDRLPTSDDQGRRDAVCT